MTAKTDSFSLSYHGAPDRRLRAGIVGATGYVGQRLITRLADHPWFGVEHLAASPASAGQTYREAVTGRWRIEPKLPESVGDLVLFDLERELEAFCEGLDLVFCAVDMPRDEVIALETALARQEVPVISNNSAQRRVPDVPMLIPEINPEHLAVIEAQKKRLGTTHGFVVCKPNCSIQSYVPALHALRAYEPDAVIVATYQAVSGAGKTLGTWPEMVGNVIPYIGGEDQKSELEPLKIAGRVEGGRIVPAETPMISAQCYRVAVPEGHTAAVSVRFKACPTEDEILDAWRQAKGLPQAWSLPSAPEPFLRYHEAKDCPQPRLDADVDGGMAIHLGRLRPDPVLNWKFTCLSHNTLRGAAGGGVLTAELLAAAGYLRRP